MFKKISKTLIPLTMLLGIGFSVSTFTSCSALNNTKGIMFKQLGSENELEENKNNSMDSFADSNKSLEKLYYGTKSVNKGNYVMFVGSDTIGGTEQGSNDGQTFNSDLYKLLSSGKNHVTPSWENADWKVDSDSPLVNIKKIGNPSSFDQNYWEKQPDKNTATGKVTNYINSVNFYSFVDRAPSQFYGNRTGTNTAQYYNFSPFYKWQNYDHNNDEFTNWTSDNYAYWLYSHDVRDYARNDESAKNYRKTIERMHLLMPDLIDADQQSLKAIAWVNGVPSTKVLTTFNGDVQDLVVWLDSVYDQVELK